MISFRYFPVLKVYDPNKQRGEGELNYMHQKLLSTNNETVNLGVQCIEIQNKQAVEFPMSTLTIIT